MGHEAVHPDEPEPWVYSIGEEEVTVPARPPAVGTLLGASNGRSQGAGTRTTADAGHTSGARGLSAQGNGTGPGREARPMRAPGLPDGASDDEPGDAESLLRELHSLAALDDALAEQGRAPARAERNGHTSHRPPTPSAAAPPPPPKDATAPRPTRGDPSAIADAFAELSALDVPTGAPARPGTSGPGHGGATTAPAGAEGSRPASPSTPSGNGHHPDTAVTSGDGGLSALFSEGPLFGSEDEPAPAAASADEPAGDRSAGDAPRRERAPDREYEATLHVVATPGRSERSGPPSGSAQRPDEVRTQPTAPPPTPVPAREPETAEDGDPTTNGHQVPSPDTGNGLDLSSFTAKGGPGSHKARGRRRRLSR